MQTTLAIITTLVAVLVAIITGAQWLTNRARLRNELFDRRYSEYEKITTFIAEILVTGKVGAGEDIKFLQDTKRAYFVFACDKEIKNLLSDIYKKAVSLQTYGDTLDGATGEGRSENIRKQREIKDWFNNTLSEMEGKFEKYLNLQH